MKNQPLTTKLVFPVDRVVQRCVRSQSYGAQSLAKWNALQVALDKICQMHKCNINVSFV